MEKFVLQLPQARVKECVEENIMSVGWRRGMLLLRHVLVPEAMRSSTVRLFRFVFGCASEFGE